MGPRDYKISEIKRLFAESNNQCSKPSCKNKLIAEDNKTIIGKICHIEAASSLGPRYNKEKNNDQLRSYDNLILLCDEHHSIIDNKENENEYKKELLQEWKRKHTKNAERKSLDCHDDLIRKIIDHTTKSYEKIKYLDGPFNLPLTEHYIERKNEGQLKKTLNNNNLLLLTGVSFCGKSQTAFNITNEYINDGFEFKRALNVNDAISFLETIDSKRICILEDPFGNTFVELNKSQVKQVRELIQNLSKQKFLIITSRIEVLLNIFNADKLEECIINQNHWYDLTISDKELLCKIWEKLPKNNINKKNREKVKKLIDNGNKLQPGELFHLFKVIEKEDEFYTESQLINISKAKINEISNDIINQGDSTWNVLTVLGLGANTKDGLSYDDINYIFEGTKKELSLDKHDSPIKSYSLKSKNEDSFINGSYESYDIDNSSKFKKYLDNLNQSGYITEINNRFIFRHPHYQDIGANLLKKISSIRQKDVLINVYNLLTCLNRESAYIVANNLDYIYDALKTSQEDLINDIIKVSKNSFFPKVAHSCYLFLLRNINNDIFKNYSKDIFHILQNKSGLGKIVIPKNGGFVIKGYVYNFKVISNKEKDVLLNKFHDDKYLELEELVEYLKYIRNYSETPSINLLKYAFKQNEIFVKNITSYLYFKNLSLIYDDDFNSKVLDNENPYVIFYALLGFFDGLHLNSKHKNNRIIDLFKYGFEEEYVFCIRASTLMTNFNTDYENNCVAWNDIPSDKHSILWDVWADLFIVFIENLPDNIEFINTPRYSNNMMKAKEIVNPPKCINITESVLNRLVRKTKNCLLDHFEMRNLFDFFISSTNNLKQDRLFLFKNFFDRKLPTYFIGSNLLTALSHWEYLNLKEQNVLINELKKADDKEWLKAICVNGRNKLPDKITNLIFEGNYFYSYDFDEILKKIDYKFLDKIFEVFFGKDPGLNPLDIDHSNQLIRNLTHQVAITKTNVKYNECVESFIYHFINHSISEDLKNKWKIIYLNSDNKIKLFEKVMECVGNCAFVFHSTKYLFEVIIEYHLKLNEGELIARIIKENFNDLCYTTSNYDLFKVLDIEIFNQTLYEVFQKQFELLILLREIKSDYCCTETLYSKLEKASKIVKSDGIKLEEIRNLFNWIIQNINFESKTKALIPNSHYLDNFEYSQEITPSKSSKLPNFKYYYSF